MNVISKISLLSCSLAAFLTIFPSYSSASDLTNEIATEVATIAAETMLKTPINYGRGKIEEPSDLLDLPIDGVIESVVKNSLSKSLNTLVQKGIIQGSGDVWIDRITTRVVTQVRNTLSSSANAAGKAGASAATTFVNGILIGVTLDITSEIVEEELVSAGHPYLGPAIGYGIQQGKVVYAAKTGGPLGAVVAQTMITGKQIGRVYQLSLELEEEMNDAKAASAYANAASDALRLRSRYMQADSKPQIESQIRREMQDSLSDYYGDDLPPEAEHYIDTIIYQYQSAEVKKYEVAQGLAEEILQNPENAGVYRDRAEEFISRNFSSEERNRLTSLTNDLYASIASDQVNEMRSLLNGLVRSETPEEDRQRLIILAKSVDPELNIIESEQRLLETIVQNLEKYERAFGQDTTAVQIFIETNSVISSLERKTTAPSEPDLCDSYDCSNLLNEEPTQQIVITPLNGGTAQEEEPVVITPLNGGTVQTGPTAEELQRQREQDEADRQARIQAAIDAENARVAEVNSLIGELDRLYILKGDLDGRIQNAENKLAVLEFNDLEQVQDRLRKVNMRIDELRGKALSSSDISALQNRQARVSQDIDDLRNIIKFRDEIYNPTTITQAQKDRLNQIAWGLGVSASAGEERWQRLLNIADTLLDDRRRVLRSIENQLATTQTDDLNKLLQEQVDLQAEQDRIAREIRETRALLSDYENQLNTTQSSIDSKLDRLSVIDPDRDYIPPRFTPMGIIDWSNYTGDNELEIPDYDVPAEDQQTVFRDDDTNEEPDTLANNTDDLSDQNTVDLGDSADPANDPVVAGRGSFSYAAGDGRSSSAQTSFTATNDQTLSSATDAGNLLRGRGNLGNSTVGAAGIANRLTGYQDTYFGEWTGTYRPGGPGACTQDPDGTFYCGVTEFSHGFWVLGNPSSTATVNNKTGSATFSGVIRGDIAEGSNVREGVVSGDADINIDFSGGDVSGQLEFDVDSNAWDTANIDGSLDDLTGDPGFFSSLSGNNQFGFGSGSFNARFYGSDASELGGAYRYDGSGSATSNGIVSGVVVAQEDTGPVTPSTRTFGIVTGGGVENNGPSSDAIFRTNDNEFDTPQGAVTSLGFPQGASGSRSVPTTNERTDASYSHLSWGTYQGSLDTPEGIPIENMFWLYGDATPSTTLEMRTGSASFSGEMRGHLIEDDGSNASINYDSVTGDVDFNIDFAADTVSGSGDLVTPSETKDFTLSGSFSSDNTSNSRSVSGPGFSVGSPANVVAELNGTQSGSGYLIGSVMGDRADEFGGAFGFIDGNEQITGIVTAREGSGVTGNPGDTAGTGDGGDGTTGDSSGGATGGTTSDTAAFISTQNTSNTVASSRGTIDRIPVQGDTLATVTIPPLDGGGTVSTTQVLAPDEYNHTQWGRWGSNADTPSAFNSDGYFVAGNLTPASVVENRTGTASYSGGMIGDFVSGSGSRSSATGTIDLEANFANQNITGQMQFAHGGNNSPFASLSSGITNGSFSQTSVNHGFSGAFFGPNAEEVGGAAWMNANGGKYNGVFRAQEATSGGAPGVGDPFPGTGGGGNSF